MRVIKSVDDLTLIRAQKQERPVGLVPTMGALHQGHISLVSQAIERCPLVIVTIFVNPTQFNDKEDLKKYPRNIERDLELLGKVMRSNDIVFTPSDEDIYPVKDTRIFNFGNLDKVMEGEHRPGHFNGVGQVVSRLFSIVVPDIAFFGQKDFQQLTIIRELVRQSGNKPEIAACPIIRESDGLAMSSRNQLLLPEIRENAGIIFNTISKVSLMLNKMDIEEVKDFVVSAINKTKGFKTEYFEIVDFEKLIPVTSRSGMSRNTRYYGCIAVIAGNIRLIDNIEIDCIDPKG